MSSPKKQAWQNPKDIMKSHRMKRQSSMTKRNLVRSKSAMHADMKDGCLQSLSSSEENVQKSQTSSATVSEAVKRKNPFVCETSPAETVVKRRSILDSEMPDSAEASSSRISRTGPSQLDTNRCLPEASKLLGILKKAEQMSRDEECPGQKTSQICDVKQKRDLPSIALQSSLSPDRGNSSSSATLENEKALKTPPIDWSLKTKMRVVVESEEKSFKRIPGIDAKNVTNFVHHLLDNGPDWSDLDIFQKLRRCCLHYAYPQFPWMRRFPRSSGEFRCRPMPAFSSNDDVLKDMHSDWTNTFTSLYQQLRGGICPYFYTCTHQFTVLFRCQRFSPEKASISALLSPSTRGLRELLTKEDIAFRLPNINMHKTETTEVIKPEAEHKTNTCTKTECLNVATVKKMSDADKSTPTGEAEGDGDRGEVEEDDEDDFNDHYGASKWLEGMGLDKKDFPSLEPLKVKLQREGFREIDNRPQSMVYVEGGDVHAFFNFLLNYPSCIASSGPQHGLPPTLLSPVPFVGGSLVQNTVKHSSLHDAPVKLPGSQRFSYSHVFEISGPILPHHALNIEAILHDRHCCEEGSSVVTFNTHLPSAALNTQAVNEPEKDQLTVNWHKLFVNFALANCGLIPAVKDTIVSSSQLADGAYVKEIKISKHGFLWS